MKTNICQINKSMSSLFLLLVLTLLFFARCVSRDGEIFGRNNPLDPLNENRYSKVLTIDSTWYKFNFADSTGTIACSIGIDIVFFKLFDSSNDSIELLKSGIDNTFFVDNMHTGTEKKYLLVVYTNLVDSIIDSGFITAPAGIPPLAPENPIATGNFAGITLSWEAPDSGGNFVVYKADSLNGKYIQVALCEEFRFLDSVSDYNIHYYAIGTRNKFGETRSSTIVSARRITNTNPPSNITITENMSDSTLILQWKPVSSISEYIIFKSKMISGPYIESGIVRDSTLIEKSLPGEKVFYRIAALDSNKQCGILSYPVMGVVSIQVSTPTNVYASEGLYGDYIAISWDKVSGAESYSLIRVSSVFKDTLLVDSITDTFYIDSVKSVSEYYYSVISVGTNGNKSKMSNPVRGFLNSIPAPVGISASDGTDSRCIQIVWDMYPNSKGYKIYKASSPDSLLSFVGNSDIPVYNDTVEDVYTWYYKVSAITKNGIESQLSKYESGYRKGLSAPLNLRVSKGEYISYVYLTWGPVSNASYYKIYRSSPPYTSYSVIAVTKGTTYFDSSCTETSYYQISAVDEFGIEGGKSTAESGYLAQLGTPSSITATYDRPNEIMVNWSSVKEADHYIIYRSTVSTTTNFVAVDTTTDTTFKDLATNSAYFRIAVLYRNRTGQLSNYAYGTVLAPPANIKASSVNASAIQLSWTGRTGAIRYAIYRSDDLGSTYNLLDTTSGLLYNDTKYTTGKYYYYKITSISNYGESKQSQSTLVIALSSPTGITANASHDTLTIAWNSVLYATSYEVYLKSPSDKDLYSAQITSNTKIILTVTESGFYKYKINSGGSGFVSEFSKIDSCYVLARPRFPTNIGATSNVGFIKLSWQPDTTAGKSQGFIIYRSTSAYGTYSVIDTTTDTLYNDTLSTTSNRYYKISAYNQSGASAQSSYVRGNTTAIPPPSSIQVSTLYGTHIEIKWRPASGAQKYVIYRSINTQNFTVVDTITDTIYRDRDSSIIGITGTGFYYAVASLGVTGESAKTISSTKGSRLPPPTTISASGSSTHIRVTWSSVTNATKYYLYRASSLNGIYIKIDSSASSGYNDSVKISGAQFYRVSSMNLSESPLSPSFDSSRLQFPATPSTISATKGTVENVVRVSWSKSAGAVSYKLYRASDSSFTQPESLIQTADTMFVDSVKSDSTYYYRVKAINYAGQSVLGPTASGYRISQTLPGSPQSFGATSADLYIRLHWEAPASIIPVNGYYIYRSASQNGDFVLIDSTTTTSYDDPVPSSFPTYYWYYIKSFNLSGVSQPTETIQASRN